MVPLPEFNSYLVQKRPTTGFRLGSHNVTLGTTIINVSRGAKHISILQTVQAWLTGVTDRETDGRNCANNSNSCVDGCQKYRMLYQICNIVRMASGAVSCLNGANRSKTRLQVFCVCIAVLVGNVLVRASYAASGYCFGGVCLLSSSSYIRLLRS